MAKLSQSTFIRPLAENAKIAVQECIHCTGDSSTDVQASGTQGSVSRDQKFGVRDDDLYIATVLTFVASQLDDLVSRSTNIFGLSHTGIFLHD